MANNDIDVGFLIKDAFVSIKNDFGYIALFMLPLIVYIAAMIHIWFVIGDIFSITQNVQNSTLMTGLLVNNMLFLVMILLVYGIVGMILYSISMAGAIKKYEMQMNNSRMDFSEALSYGIGQLPRFFSAMFLYIFLLLGPVFILILLMALGVFGTSAGAAAILLLFILCYLIFILYAYFRLALFMQACVIENLGPVECLKRSWNVTKGNVILIFVTVIIVGIVGVIFSIPFMIVGNFGIPYVSTIGNFVSFAIMGPVSAIVYTIIYLKLTRKPAPPPTMSPQYQVHYGANQPPYNP